MQPCPSNITHQTVAVEGHLVYATEHQRQLRTDQPLDHIWLFRSGRTWTTLTLHRTETWDDTSATPRHASARATVERHDGLPTIETAITARYGSCAWDAILDAGHRSEPELFDRWAPGQIERDLERATFHRPDLAGVDPSLRLEVEASLMTEIAGYLEGAGFEDVRVGGPWPTEQADGAVARVIARRMGYKIRGTSRIDGVGEVYTRLDHLRRIGADDE